jgi:hypothetical protein
MHLLQERSVIWAVDKGISFISCREDRHWGMALHVEYRSTADLPVLLVRPQHVIQCCPWPEIWVERPTVKARYSRKYFGRGKGVVDYTLLCNHVPLSGYLIGAHDYEAHHVFDIWYRNTSDIVPTAITGDMHSVNKANFAIHYWFGLRFEPRFNNLDDQLKELYCVDDPARYEKYLIRPIGKPDCDLIISEKTNTDQIVATLGLKEMTQGTLIRRLCTYTAANPTRCAVFEFDKVVHSIYTLRYLRDPQLERNVHRSRNRIEFYHQLRSAIAQIDGKKELTGLTDIEIEISNQCARLMPTRLSSITPPSCRGY